MATLRDVLETVNGLYQEPDTGRRFGRQELLERLPIEDLSRTVRLWRLGTGVYGIGPDQEHPMYELLSRRHRRRGAATA